MRRSTSRFLTLALLSALCGPSCRQHARPTAAATTIVTSFYPMYVATVNVAGGIPGVAVVNMTRPFTGCLHDYQLTPQDMVALEGASAFVVNGAGMEGFLDKVIQSRPSLPVIQAGGGIALLPSREPGEGGRPEFATNPHVWTSISNAMAQVHNIAEGLSHFDTAHADQYRANATAYIARLDSLRKEAHAALDSLPSRTIVTMHEAFDYFAQEFGLSVAAVVERVPGVEPSATELAGIIDLVKKQRITALFSEPQYPTKTIENIAGEIRARVFVLDPVVTGPMDADAYVATMRVNLTALRSALGSPQN